MILNIIFGTTILSLTVDACAFLEIIFDIIKDGQKITLERIRLGYAIMGVNPSHPIAIITYFIPFFNLLSSFSKRYFYKKEKKKFDSLFYYFKKTKDSIIQGDNKLYPLDAHKINMDLSLNPFPINSEYQVSYKKDSETTVYFFNIVNGMAVLDRNSPLYDCSLITSSSNLREILKRISLYLGSMDALEFDNVIKKKKKLDIEFVLSQKDAFSSIEKQTSVLELYTPHPKVKKLTKVKK